jgi:hypothetical protein
MRSKPPTTGCPKSSMNSPPCGEISQGRSTPPGQICLGRSPPSRRTRGASTQPSRTSNPSTLKGLARRCRIPSQPCQQISFPSLLQPRGSQWPFDHHIHLLPSTPPVTVRPYWYPQLLKDEIEKQCDDMLRQGIIRPNMSPFSAPVLLVCKKDHT